MFKRALYLGAIFALLLFLEFLTPKNARALNADCFILNPLGQELPCLGPSGTQVFGNGTGTTAAVTGTIAAVAAKTNYLCEFDISITATGAILGQVTITGLLGGTRTYQLNIPATPAVNLLSKSFSPCLPASAVNTAIVVNSPAAGVGGVNDVNSSGYQN